MVGALHRIESEPRLPRRMGEKFVLGRRARN